MSTPFPETAPEPDPEAASPFKSSHAGHRHFAGAALTGKAQPLRSPNRIGLRGRGRNLFKTSSGAENSLPRIEKIVRHRQPALVTYQMKARAAHASASRNKATRHRGTDPVRLQCNRRCTVHSPGGQEARGHDLCVFGQVWGKTCQHDHHAKTRRLPGARSGQREKCCIFPRQPVKAEIGLAPVPDCRLYPESRIEPPLPNDAMTTKDSEADIRKMVRNLFSNRMP